MMKFAVAATLAALFVLGITVSSAQQAAPAAPQPAAAPKPPAAPHYPENWAGKEFNEPMPNIEGAEALINETCQPKSLDGIEIFGMQKGHNEPINLHVYCRQDHAASALYKLNAVPVVGRKLGEALNPTLVKPNTRIVGFYFGKDGQDDLLLAIEKVK